MSTKITIEVLGISKESIGEVEFYLPALDIQVEGDKEMSNAAGIALIGYQKIATQFIESHPEDCVGCPAYLTHKEILDFIGATKIKIADK